MFAITGITGKVGGATARVLLEAGKQLRAVVRDEEKGRGWQEAGCEVALAEMSDAGALAEAFRGAEGVFILLPPIFDPTPGFAEVRATIEAIREALLAAKPEKVVVLSTIGAQATEPNLLNALGVMEERLSTLPMPVAFLRAAWFMENASWDVASARDSGVIYSFLQPLDKPVPMVGTPDIGRVAAKLLLENWQGVRTVELEGPRRVTPVEVAETFGKVLGRVVRAEIVPRESWEGMFLGHGMKNPMPRMRMLDGFNEGWIAFEGGEGMLVKGETSLETVLRGLV